MDVTPTHRPSLALLAALLMGLPGPARGEDDRPADRLPGAVEVLGVDGRPMTLEAPEGGVLAIAFLWTPCPNSNQYSPTLNAIAGEFGTDRVRFVGLFVDADLTDAEVAAHAEEYALGFPIGRSGAVRLARELGVGTVPSAVVVDDAGRIRYRGRIDDQFFDLGRRRQVVRSHDLKDAIAALLGGEEVRAPRTEAIGCTLPDFGPGG
ncbi:redoxin family protein [Tautonia plasticadhaerens]|uniref:Thiol-disulfide oxidoreductase ResA n=1 Tax=Tautonia plasticadhaerens TaxID=2527974 RepID=A0A518GVU1_9BACT|nr:redoxin family protein [Tautonia plasticadhaerens]QDV32715.1 Thiol-disulfide oxidoreductase ResA [Tautonia plasticadhaerens]